MVATVKQSQPKDLNLDDAPAKQCDVFLVDGNGLAYRAFYALPEELQTVEGLPTNALLGLANMFMRMLMDYRPRTVLVAWDSKPTGRLEIAADYKAHRKPMPDLLRQQQPWFEPVVEAFGYRNLKVEGKEADDVIGTLARMAEDAGHKVCVVSTDRDAFQLASDNVCIMMTPRGVQDVVVYTPERIIQRYGIGPDVIPDFIGLKGDTSDNIAGVPGIGDKTAAELLVQFGSMEGVYANLDAVSGAKRRQSLADAAKDAADSKRLATIDREIPLDVDFDALVVEPPDRSTMKELFRKLEFRALLKRVDELEEALPGAPPSEPSDTVEIAWREGGVDELRSLGTEVGARRGRRPARGLRRRVRRRRDRAGGPRRRGAPRHARHHPRAEAPGARARGRHGDRRVPARPGPVRLRDRRPRRGVRCGCPGRRRRGDRGARPGAPRRPGGCTRASTRSSPTAT